MNVNLKSLVARLNDTCRGALEGAAGLCLSRTNYDVEVEHLLVKLLESSDTEASVYAWLRKGRAQDPAVAAVVNMTPVERRYRIGLPNAGHWDEILNSDAEAYGGGNRGNMGGVLAEKTAHHGQPFSAVVTLPPLSAVWFRAAK